MRFQNSENHKVAPSATEVETPRFSKLPDLLTEWESVEEAFAPSHWFDVGGI